jgi:hypothetical protein
VPVATDAQIAWLLEGDPAVRWPTLAGLTGASPRDVAAERARVATEGWGARLLAAQNPDGGWGDGPYSPKWTSTTYTLLRLRLLGLPSGHPATAEGCARLWDWQARWSRRETCIVSLLVQLTCAHGYAAERLDELVEHLLAQQLDDGGWNCTRGVTPSTHSSFHTSILALEALHAYATGGGARDVGAALHRGQEFFLTHRLYQSHRTGEVAIRASTKFPAFPEWHFDVLRGLEHFAGTDAPRDERLADAVEVVRRARRKDGRWSTYAPYAGRQWFAIEPPGASRWNTQRVLRVLDWWESAPVGRRRVSRRASPDARRPGAR